MSRIKNIIKRKKNIKSTISSLALVLAIGGIGSLGSYAYFTDKAEAKNDLVVTMGRLDVDFKEKSDDIKLDKDNYYKDMYQTFKITNNGTLIQNVSFKFADFTNSSILDKLDCKLQMKYNDKKVILKDKNISKLSDLNNMNYKDLVYENNELVDLKPQESIKCKLIININPTNINISELQNKTIEFNSEVKSRQLDSEEVVNNEK